jgi:hypothetical protein
MQYGPLLNAHILAREHCIMPQSLLCYAHLRVLTQYIGCYEAPGEGLCGT